MSAEYPDIERDRTAPSGENELPTYDDLAAQNGPNSRLVPSLKASMRFGRWRGWIEKRAAERYLDVSPEERARRRERGWGDGTGMPRDATYVQATRPNVSVASSLDTLHIQTDNLRALPPFDPETPSPSLPPLPFSGERLAPTHLKVNQFGSKFLPHTKSQIRCLLPLEANRLLLIGHDEGLSVLDMFPQECSDSGGVITKGPDEARARLIWQGESVFQMSLLEVESNGEGTPQGVILALVGPEPGSTGVKDPESMRSLRMYNLASITSLAKWTVAQKGARPLDLRRPSNWQVQQSPSKRTKTQSSSIARSLKSFMDPPSGNFSQQGSSSSYSDMLSPSPSLAMPNRDTSNPTRLAPNRNTPDDSSWEVVDDLPLRWATDFVPLAANGSRLLNLSVLSYALWTNEGHKGKAGRLLAVATKNNILLYETPKGERAFHFVKEFYTPLQPRSITFFQQSVQDVGRNPWDVGTPRHLHTPHRRSDSSSTLRASSDSFHASTPSATLNYGTHLSLFVVFEKKAGWIRLADSAVGEMELYSVGGSNTHRASDTSSTSSLLKSRLSSETPQLPRWLAPVRCTLPIPDKPGVARDAHLITRGKLTHILPSPLPVGVSSYPPLFVASWRSVPTSISARVSHPSADSGGSSLLQMIAMSEHGVEVQEVPLSFLSKGKGKGKAQHSEDPLWAEEDFGGDVGFLCTGGHWDQSYHLFHRQQLSRSRSRMSAISAISFTSMESEDVLDKMKQEEGVYAWRREGLEDWRVFWVGGPLTGGPQDADR